MSEATENLAEQAARPDEKENVKDSSNVSDGASSTIRHPLDPLNAGKY